MNPVIDEATKPVNMILGASVVAAGVFTGTLWVAACGVGLYAGLTGIGFLTKRNKKTGIDWEVLRESCMSAPQAIRLPTLALLKEAKALEAMNQEVGTATEIIQADLVNVIDDVMEMVEQGRLMDQYLNDWNISELQQKLHVATSQEQADALQEQLATIKKLSQRYLDLQNDMEILQAQLGAVRAKLLQTQLDKTQPTDVHLELSNLRDNAHAIQTSYAQLTQSL